LAVSSYDALALIEEQRAIRSNEDERIFPYNHKSVRRGSRRKPLRPRAKPLARSGG